MLLCTRLKLTYWTTMCILSSTHPGTRSRTRQIFELVLVLCKLAYFDSATTEQLLIIASKICTNKEDTFFSCDQAALWMVFSVRLCIKVKTYDERDAFKFEIINYPDLSGNIPTKPAYEVFTSQVIRRICSKKGDLLERVKSLSKKLLRKHYTINGLKSSLKKCLKKHRWITTKLGPRLHQNLTEE